MSSQLRIVVVGNGMVGHHLVARLIASGVAAQAHLTVVGEEPRLAYDRVNLSKFFEGKTADDLSVASRAEYEQAGVELVLGDQVATLDRQARRVTTASGRVLEYDKLVLATGS